MRQLAHSLVSLAPIPELFWDRCSLRAGPMFVWLWPQCQHFERPGLEPWKGAVCKVVGRVYTAFPQPVCRVLVPPEGPEAQRVTW